MTMDIYTYFFVDILLSLFGGFSYPSLRRSKTSCHSIVPLLKVSRNATVTDWKRLPAN